MEEQTSGLERALDELLKGKKTEEMRSSVRMDCSSS
jgi:hypothetical protein